MERTVNTKFYEYRQNNSGGSFSNSEKEGIAEYVIIEALNAEHEKKHEAKKSAMASAAKPAQPTKPAGK